MSFSAMYAGPQTAVAEKLADAGALGSTDFASLTREFLAKVAAMVPAERSAIIEVNGHADNWTVGLNIKVVTVHGM